MGDNLVMLRSLVLNNGETYAYREAGTGAQNLLLIHGNMTSSKHWDLVMEKLEDKAHIYAVDLRGFGLSSYQQKINSLKDFSEDLKLFVDQLNLKNFSLVGWSVGGGVAMQFAADYPTLVEKLILVGSVGIQGCPILRKDEQGIPIIGDFLKTQEEITQDISVAPVLAALQNRDKVFYRNLWNQVIYTKHQPSPEKYEEYLEDMLTQRNLAEVMYALVHFNISQEFNGIEPGSGDVERIKSPTLVFQGTTDVIMEPRVGEEIAKNIKGSELVILEDCGHSPMIDCLEIFLDKIVKFMQLAQSRLT
jgi:pimeloyl-ACP methyl ester carboxylesterase